MHRGEILTLAPGESLAAPRAAGFRDTPAGELSSLVAEIEAGRPWREAVAARYARERPWLHKIITSENRVAFFEGVLPTQPGLVLDIGAGWGQVCRPLAARHQVVALEPVAERLAFIKAAARQDRVDQGLSYLGVDYFDVQFETRFDTICAIGVLEWVGAFQDETDPQARQREFLSKTRTELAPGGSLVIGIENRLGLKYLLGCADDHIGLPQVACLPAPLARRRWAEGGHGNLQTFTYSLDEIRALLLGAGFSRIDCFAAFPDYKLPEKILPMGEAGKPLNRWLLEETTPPEHNGYDGSVLPSVFQAALSQHYPGLAASGKARHFVPSFFIRAC